MSALTNITKVLKFDITELEYTERDSLLDGVIINVSCVLLPRLAKCMATSDGNWISSLFCEWYHKLNT